MRLPVGEIQLLAVADFRIAHAVKIVCCTRGTTMPIGSGTLAFFIEIRAVCPAGMTLVHRDTMDASFLVTVIPAFLFAQTP